LIEFKHNSDKTWTSMGNTKANYVKEIS